MGMVLGLSFGSFFHWVLSQEVFPRARQPDKKMGLALWGPCKRNVKSLSFIR